MLLRVIPRARGGLMGAAQAASAIEAGSVRLMASSLRGSFSPSLPPLTLSGVSARVSLVEGLVGHDTRVRSFASAAKPEIKSTVKRLVDLPLESLKDQKVFVRVDFNVKVAKTGRKDTDGQDEYAVSTSSMKRVLETVPTLRHLLDVKAKVILASHLGDPGVTDPATGAYTVADKAAFSLKPVAVGLRELLQAKVHMAPDSVGPVVAELAGAMQGGEVLLLENVRFHQGEQGDAAQLSAYSKAIVDALAAKGGPVSVYVNDAFGTAHRAHASVVGVPALVQGPKVAGLLMAKEVKYLDGVFASSTASSSPGGGAGTRKGVAAVIGGAKLKSKLPVFEHLLNKVDALVVGGAMALPFLRAQGYQTGVTPDGAEAEASAKQIIEKSTAKGVALVLPVDVVIASSLEEKPETVTVAGIADIPKDKLAVDIGPETSKLIRDVLAPCGTVIWNGPMGVIENPKFAEGTYALIKTISALEGATTVAGGGETSTAIEALKKTGFEPRFTHVSTGGGASLEMLKGKTLPALKVLDKAQ